MIDIEKVLKNGVDLHMAGHLQKAEQAYRSVLEVSPDHPDATHFMGVLAMNVNRLDMAKSLISKAIQLAPDNHACYLNLANVFQQEGDFENAVQLYEKSKELNPNNPKVYNNLGVAFSKLGRIDDSIAHLEISIRLDANYAEAHNNLSESYKFAGRYDDALHMVEKAVQLQPGFVEANWNRAILLLLKGDLKNGFKEYEWRWKRPKTPIRLFDSGQQWQGQPFEGKTLLVYEEQGLGDTLQFIRYLPEIQKMGGHVIFEVVPPLLRLVEQVSGFDRLWVGQKAVDPRPVDRFDFRVPLLSLPGIFQTSLETIPGQDPYIHADPDLSAIWKKRLIHTAPLKIGIVWAGHADHSNDINRSVPLHFFQSLSEIDGVGLYSLQKEKYDRWTDVDPEKMLVQDLGDQISDFADTAAIIDHLDLVISVDTSVVHLAGAMGKQVWTLLPFSPDWRWMIDTEDSPWYPTMTLFRQPALGDWPAVFKRLEKKIKDRLK
jgi:Flp pilus assembly protein TadD